MRTDETSTPWSTLTHRNPLLSNAHATPRIPRSFDEEEGERECSTSSGCSTVDYDDQFSGSPRFYRNRTSKRREHQRQHRCCHGATSRFGGSRVRRSEALLAALCMSAIALVWIITRDGGVSFPLLSLLCPRAFRARETDSITGIFEAGWAPNDAVQGLMATSKSSPLGHDATLLNDPRPPSEWLEKAEKFEIPFKKVNGEPRAIDRAESKHRAGGGGGGDGDRSIRNGNDPPKRNIDEGVPAQTIGVREDGLHEERLFSGTPVDVHKAVIVDTALASAREKKREWSGEKIEGRPRSKVVEGDVENPRLDDVEGKGGGGDAWGKYRANETKEPLGTNTGGSIRSQVGGFPKKAGLSGGPDDDDKISLHTSSSIQGMTSNAVDLLAPITGKRGEKASSTGVEEIAVANGTPIHPSHRIRTDDNVESNRRETIPGEGKKNPEAKINGLGKKKKQEVKESMNTRIEDATVATATDVAAPAEHENWTKQKTKKGDEATYDKEALPAEWGGDIDRDDSGKRDMLNPESKPQRTGGMAEHSPALPSEPLDAAIATGGLKKKAVRARTEVAALRIEPVEYAAHLAEEVARDEAYGEGRAAGGGESAGTQLTGQDEGVRRDQKANEGRGPVEAGTGYQATTVTQRSQRGEVLVNKGKPLRVRPRSRNASRWAQALGAGDDDDANENHPPLPPPPPIRDQRKKTGTDDEARATGKTCRLTGKVDHWEPPEAADLRSTYRWKDEQKATMEKIRRFSKGGNELRDLIHSEVVRLDILRHDLFCP